MYFRYPLCRLARLAVIPALAACLWHPAFASDNSPSAKPAPESQVASIDRRFQQVMSRLVENGEFSGSAVFAVNGVAVSHFAGGPFDRQGTSNQLDTPFNIGSVGKLFTQALVLRRVAEGRLELDEPISTYLPESRLPNADQVTLRQLLNHTSGYGNYFTHPDYSLAQKELADFLQLARSAEVKFEPGKGHYYSNTAFWVAAAVLEAVDPQERGWARQFRELIAQPLGVTLHFIQPDDEAPQRPEAFSLTPTGDTAYVPPREEARPGPDGGIYMTTADLFTVQQALLRGELYPLAMLEESVASPYTYPGLYCDVGLVWELCPQKVRRYRTKGGTTSGGGAMMADTTSEGNTYSLVMLSNYHNAPMMVYPGIFEAMFHPDRPLPRQSAARQLLETIEQNRLQSIDDPQRWWQEHGLFTNFASLPLLGMQVEKAGKLEAARTLYQMNLLRYPGNRVSERLLERVEAKLSGAL